MNNQYNPQPKFDDGKEPAPKLRPYFFEKKYSVTDVEIPLSQLYTSTNGIVSDRRFINATTLGTLAIMDGATGSIVYIPSKIYGNCTPQFKIIASISDLKELQMTPRNRGTRLCKEFVIQEFDLQSGPIKIPELNLIVMTQDMIPNTSFPNPQKENDEYRKSLENELAELLKNHSYCTYIELPNTYKGLRSFYIAINHYICQLPILEVDSSLVDGPTLIVRRKDGLTGLIEEEIIPLNVATIKHNPKVVIGDNEYLIGIDPQRLYKTDQLEQEITATHKEKISQLNERNKLLDSKIKDLKAENEQFKARLTTMKDVADAQQATMEVNYKQKKLELDSKTEIWATIGKILGATAAIVVALKALLPLLQTNK